MLFKDFIKKNLDVDVASDFSEDLYVNFVGPAYKFTSAGREKFRPLFDVELDIEEDNSFALLCLQDYDSVIADNLERLAIKYFNWQAGYCTEATFAKYFKQDNYKP